MRRLYAILIILCFVSTLSSQTKPGEKKDVKTDTKAKTETKTETKKDAKTDTKTPVKTDKKETTQPVKNDTAIEKIPDGYGNLTWGMYLSDAKGKITGVLSYTDEKKVIVAKDRELEYLYGFFYKEPSAEAQTAKKEETKTATDKQPETTQEKDEGKLFYVSMSFPYLDKDKVYEKLKAKYGQHTGENIKDNQGAIAWDSENTIVIMWVDRYEKKPYCRKIIYISKKISQELNEYTNTIFNKSEIDLINKMKP